ncbi:MAG: FHA domain-containing protein [Deltaproteobacteria bacterium]|nr:FHA domain-containing protein [Deltaproteobacteria bacterium]
MGKKTHTLQVRVSEELTQRLDQLLAAEDEVQARFPQLFIDRSFNRANVTRLALGLGLRQLAGEAAFGEVSALSNAPIAWLYPEEGKGSVIALAVGVHRIGRDPAQADVIVADKRISRLHCALFVDSSKEITIRSLSDSGRTFINGHAVDEEQALHPGDVIGFSSKVIYRLVTKPSARPTRHELASPVVQAIRDFGTETLEEGRRSAFEMSQIMGAPHTSAMREFLDALDRFKPQVARVYGMGLEPGSELEKAYQEALRVLARATTIDDEALDDARALELARKLDEVGVRLHRLLGASQG